ncbi:Bifunctional xylanase/deacetylase precursor [Aedoeadaptatus ivorii]|uniref:Bifunctional xylanase/deacetylase n=1 Tax=Aedoeadaptatus ivorii TaxID=54006 RepID=A0A3S4Y7Y7_9FIRM|nr:polysaccharide deacetylase family protein [Peptoniphilus ivorii]VEJ36115.1 Bifunctional xylanase/deacetylase precursor [Peptoniphilus ivorii]
MNREEMDRERRRRRERMRQRRNRARLRGLLLLLLIAVGGVFALGKIKSGLKTDDGYAYGQEADWFVLKNLDLLDADTAYAPQNAINLTNNIINDRIEIRLQKGQNHINQADPYAFDAGEISDIIEGKTEYTGETKWAFLTFDDGPNHKITPQILDTLREKEAYATFFLVGKSITEDNRDVLLRELADGHALALHSFSHDYHKLYPSRVGNADAIGSEAKRAQEALQKVISSDFHSGVWRYPGGHMSWSGLDAADAALKAQDISWIDWNALTGDAEPKSRRPTTEPGLVEFMNRSIAANTDNSVVVILMHDAESKQLTANALGDVIDSLKSQGYEFGILK